MTMTTGNETVAETNATLATTTVKTYLAKYRICYPPTSCAAFFESILQPYIAVMSVYDAISIALYTMTVLLIIRKRKVEPYNSEFFMAYVSMYFVDVTAGMLLRLHTLTTITDRYDWLRSIFVQLGAGLTKFVICLRYWTALSQLCHLLILAATRSTAVLLAMRHNKIWTRKRMTFLLVMAWAVPLAAIKEYLFDFEYRMHQYEPGGKVYLQLTDPKYNERGKAYMTPIMFGSCAALVAAYCAIFAITAIKKRSAAAPSTNTDRKIARMTALCGFVSLYLAIVDQAAFGLGDALLWRFYKVDFNVMMKRPLMYFGKSVFFIWANPYLLLALAPTIRQHFVAHYAPKWAAGGGNNTTGGNKPDLSKLNANAKAGGNKVAPAGAP